MLFGDAEGMSQIQRFKLNTSCRLVWPAIVAVLLQEQTKQEYRDGLCEMVQVCGHSWSCQGPQVAGIEMGKYQSAWNRWLYSTNRHAAVGVHHGPLFAAA